MSRHVSVSVPRENGEWRLLYTVPVSDHLTDPAGVELRSCCVGDASVVQVVLYDRGDPIASKELQRSPVRAYEALLIDRWRRWNATWNWILTKVNEPEDDE